MVDRDAGRMKTSHDARWCDVRQRPRRTVVALSLVVLLSGMVANRGADVGGVRFHELLKMHPIYPGDEGG